MRLNKFQKLFRNIFLIIGGSFLWCLLNFILVWYLGIGDSNFTGGAHSQPVWFVFLISGFLPGILTAIILFFAGGGIIAIIIKFIEAYKESYPKKKKNIENIPKENPKLTNYKQQLLN